jgi:putative phosphoesterase
MKVGILSDTHDLLRSEVTAALQGCDCILHGGDISSREILDRLEAIAPVRAVRGNNDRDWAEQIPAFLDFELEGLRICMAHQKKHLPRDLGGYDLAVCGHTHRYVSEWLEHPGSTRRTLLLNPGSCGPRRFGQPITLAILRTGAEGFTAKRIEIPHKQKEAEIRMPDRGDLRKQIDIVIRETRKGTTTEEVAGKYGMDPKLTEQIARLYVTHPGVTPEGIMAKMGL